MITENAPSRRFELYEILNKIELSITEEQRITNIRYFASRYTAFEDYLRCLLDDRIKFNLPEGRPPFTPADDSQYPTTWHKSHRDLGYFVHGGKGDQMHSSKREKMWIDLLEGIHPEDANIIADVSDKRGGPEWLTKEIVEKALPNLIS
jgi:hypothetical protein